MKKLLKILTALLPIYWLIFIVVQYFSNYPAKLYSILNFSHYDFVIAALIVNWVIYKVDFIRFFKHKKQTPNLNGLKILLSVVLNILIAFLLSVDFSSSGNILSVSWNLIAKLGYSLLTTYLVLISAYALGDLILTKIFRKNFSSEFLRYFLYSCAIGIIAIVYLLFALGAVSKLTAIPTAILLLLPLVLNFKKVWKLTKLVTLSKLNLNTNTSTSLIYCSGIVMISFILLNLLKPFSVGWDSSSLYLNTSNLLSQTSQLVSGIEAYNWPIFTSIGLIVFKNMPTTLMLTFVGAILALLMLFDLSLKFVNKKYAVWLVFIIFSLPSFLFLSVIDQKIDLAYLFFGLTAVSLLLDFIQTEQKQTSKLKYILLAGLVAGFAFGMKYTAFFLIVGLISMLFYSSLGIAGGLIALSTSLILLFSFPLLQLRVTEFSPVLKYVLIGGNVAILLGSTVYIYFKKLYVAKLPNLIKYCVVFVIMLIAAFSPWLVYNYTTLNSFSLNGLLYGKNYSPGLDIVKLNNTIKDSKEALDTDNSNIPTPDTGLKEELGRYAGYENDTFKYFTIFNDVNLGVNVKGPIVDIGFLLLALVPLTSIFLNYNNSKKNSFVWLAILSVAFINICFLITLHIGDCSTNTFFECATQKFNLSTPFTFGLGFISYLFLPVFWLIVNLVNWINPVMAVLAIIFVNLLLIVPIFLNYKSKKVKALGVFLFSTFVLWTILGTGVYWYGIVSFCLLFIIIFMNLSSIEDQKYFIPHGERLVTLSKYAIAIWMIIAFFGLFQIKNSNTLIEASFIKYINNNLDSYSTLEILNSAYAEGVKPINENKEAKVYKVGSFLYFFISDNYKRVLQDNQLDTFNEINLTKDNIANKAKVAEALKAQGFEYIIYDLNTASIDRTIEKTLVKKAEKFEDFLRDNSKLELISTDRVYVDKENGTEEVSLNGKKIKSSKKVFGDEKNLLRAGSVAIYKIK